MEIINTAVCINYTDVDLNENMSSKISVSWRSCIRANRPIPVFIETGKMHRLKKIL